MIDVSSLECGFDSQVAITVVEHGARPHLPIVAGSMSTDRFRIQAFDTRAATASGECVISVSSNSLPLSRFRLGYVAGCLRNRCYSYVLEGQTLAYLI
ncbi:hypothetical protein BAUCODRAFT_29001 [Baudoinia panamericana UAMH 10762]|uniref:Uncharacterized protein n=1 Tax=Baudoinia panamericana (strain UAMH 10762) TaxID=717646 RepID=M2N921_BAUPA|nr:uncharacterized protein BAUCODRAFT_29001 [Baudoinia panamericana UAMH 10762]EMD00654.1 hypothetical protein BAUCODRAFT_29001 [Baudoinia panamericana UAMH 10762]